MGLNFVNNNYLLIWTLLYGPSISNKTHAFKQKLWLTYKKQYQSIEKDKEEILIDAKNYIPDDNTLYDIIDDTRMFLVIEREANAHRMTLLKSFDKYKRKIEEYIKDVVRIELDNYQVIVLHPSMNTHLLSENTPNIAWGYMNDSEDLLYTHLLIIKTILSSEVKYKDEKDDDIKNAILELAILNECYTRFGKSNYMMGSEALKALKIELYPYFLMYLGVDLEDTTSYMMRDNIAFEQSKYTNEIQLRRLNIFEFIDFVVRNKKHILKRKQELVEVL